MARLMAIMRRASPLLLLLLPQACSSLNVQGRGKFLRSALAAAAVGVL